MFGSKLGFDELWVCRFFVDLVNSNDNLCVSSSGEANCLDRLWLHTVIGSNHNNNNVSKGRAVSTERSKGFVARGIKQGNRAVFSDRLVGAHVLRITTRFAFDNFLAEN